MLIGKTLTVAQVENAMQNKLKENKNDENKLISEFENIKSKFQHLDKFITIDDVRQKNPDYSKLENEFNIIENKLNELEANNRFMRKKLDEIAELEVNSQPEYDKDKEKVTLSLNDCVLLGIDDSYE